MGRIENYRFGHVEVDGEETGRDVIVLPDRVVRNWWRQEGHGLVMEDLDGIIDDLPERLIVGTGFDGRMHPDAETVARLRERGVQVECLRTTQAVARFGELDPARTAAALHLTC